MLTVSVNKSGYHTLNFSSQTKSSLNYKRKNFQRSEEWTDENLRRCILSTKSLIKRIILNQTFNKTTFLTLTFKENITDKDFCVYEFTKFMQRLNYLIYKTKKKQIKYIAVPETQKRGAWHFHILLFDVPFIPISSMRKIWKYGNFDMTKVNNIKDQNHLANYISKYIQKDFIRNIKKGSKKYFASKGLDKGFKISYENGSIDSDIVVDGLLSQNDCKLLFSKQFQIDVNKEIKIKNLYEIYFSESFYDLFKNLYLPPSPRPPCGGGWERMGGSREDR